jgi:hypothetical protein
MAKSNPGGIIIRVAGLESLVRHWSRNATWAGFALCRTARPWPCVLLLHAPRQSRRDLDERDGGVLVRTAESWEGDPVPAQPKALQGGPGQLAARMAGEPQAHRGGSSGRIARLLRSRARRKDTRNVAGTTTRLCPTVCPTGQKSPMASDPAALGQGPPQAYYACRRLHALELLAFNDLCRTRRR